MSAPAFLRRWRRAADADATLDARAPRPRRDADHHAGARHAAYVLLALWTLNAILNPQFLSLRWQDGHAYGPLIDILNRAAPLMVVAMGMTLVIAVRGIDISVGAVVAIAGAVAASLVTHEGATMPMTAAILGALGAAALCGLFNGLLVVAGGIQPIIATLILMVAGRGIAQLITDGQIITIYHEPYFFLGSGFLLGLPFAPWIALGVAALFGLLKHRTALGLFLQASGANPAAARLAGVHAAGLMLAVYIACGLCAGVAGLMISANIKSADANNAGLMLELDAILAVALGGTSLLGGRFSLRGSLLGALIIQTLTTSIYALGIAPEVTLVVKAAVVFAVSISQAPAWRAWRERWQRRAGATS
ncbi:ABC transporter permease [Roseateles sp.]|uniref:ABC transporter permease n=1 Tax=Roseateles sp. TaxID=1971397 RepID=UPI002F410EB8